MDSHFFISIESFLISERESYVRHQSALKVVITPWIRPRIGWYGHVWEDVVESSFSIGLPTVNLTFR